MLECYLSRTPAGTGGLNPPGDLKIAGSFVFCRREGTFLRTLFLADDLIKARRARTPPACPPDLKQTAICAYPSAILLGGAGTECNLGMVVGRTCGRADHGADHREGGIGIAAG